MPVTPRALPSNLLALLLVIACTPGTSATAGDDDDGGPVDLCGPSTAKVAKVIDGDTIVLTTGEKVRYLMIDTPEITNGKHDCYGQDARDYNASLVLGQEIELTYDVECKDVYGRLLAYVEAPDGEVNTLLVERGFACVLYLPPNGEERASEFMTLELEARQSGEGLWGACQDIACD